MAKSDLIHQNRIFAWIGLATSLLLLVPLVLMQFDNEVNWGFLDFIFMGALLFGSSSLFVFAARHIPRQYRGVLAVIIAAAFVYIWAELAVGIFFSLGS